MIFKEFKEEIVFSLQYYWYEMLLLLALMFGFNCLFGTDRLWNYTDYRAISEKKAVEQAKEVKLVFPTMLHMMNSTDSVKLKPGETVKLVTQYRRFLCPLIRSLDYRPEFEYVVMRGDGVIGHCILPEAIIGAYGSKYTDESGDSLVVTNIEKAKNVTYQYGGETRKSIFPFRVCISDGSKIALEELSWKRLMIPHYNARGDRTSVDTLSALQHLELIKRPTVKKSKLSSIHDVNDLYMALGVRGVGYYQPVKGLLNSTRMNSWMDRGIAGTIEGILFLLFVLNLPRIIRRTVFYLPGPNALIYILSSLSMLGLIYLWVIWMVGVSPNLFFALVGLWNAYFIKDELRSCRCKHCHAVGHLVRVDGGPVHVSKSGYWRSDSRKIGTLNTTAHYGDGHTRTTSSDIMRKGREHVTTTTESWNEVYYCNKCHKESSYFHSVTTSSGSGFGYTESEKSAIDRAKRR